MQTGKIHLLFELLDKGCFQVIIGSSGSGRHPFRATPRVRSRLSSTTNLGINTGFSGNTESFANGDKCSGAGVDRSATFPCVTDPSASAVTGVVEEVETCV